MSEAFPAYPGSVMAARRSWAHAHRNELEAFVRALEAGYAWLQKPENAGEALDLLPSRLAIAPRAAAGVLDAFAKRPPPKLSAQGIREVIDTVWEAEGYVQPKGAPEKYVDLSFAKGAG
jgi:ABC-type nitrate/sulfonate/bicarbonate transport system substrate-binding protein